MFEKNLRKIREQMGAAALRAGRDVGKARLIAVSKTQSLESIREVYDEGQVDFGENYVQELVPKMEQLQSTPVRWHFIGPLQSNKVRKIIDPRGVGQVSLIHSADRLSLLQEISRQCKLHDVTQDVLIQVNVAGEDSKSGVAPQALEKLVAEALSLPCLRICGLMTMPPWAPDPESNRVHFRHLKEIFDALKSKFFNNEKGLKFCELSMGTSQDFEVALEEGATLIRVGTQIFGERTPER